MIINLVPEFLSLIASPARDGAYREYLQRHQAVLSAYWHNFVLDLDSPHAEEVIRSALAADRRDLERLVATVDLADDVLAHGSFLKILPLCPNQYKTSFAANRAIYVPKIIWITVLL